MKALIIGTGAVGCAVAIATINGVFLREKLFDYVDIVIAPVLIGGKETSSLIDGSSILSKKGLSGLGILKLIECTVFERFLY